VQETRDRLKALIRERCVLHGDFVLASGMHSPVYFDCKRATLDPEGIHLISTLILEHLDDLARRDGRPIDAIGGPTIGADAIVGHVAGLSWQRVAEARAAEARAAAPPAPRPIRAFLVRKEVKEHGTRRVIENEIPSGSRVAIFEDVVTTGGSTLEAIRRAQEGGMEVVAVLAVVDREAGGAEALARFRYHPLFKKSEFGI
jgi:orotate phosphoribosyltransferase